MRSGDNNGKTKIEEKIARLFDRLYPEQTIGISEAASFINEIDQKDMADLVRKDQHEKVLAVIVAFDPFEKNSLEALKSLKPTPDACRFVAFFQEPKLPEVQRFLDEHRGKWAQFNKK